MESDCWLWCHHVLAARNLSMMQGRCLSGLISEERLRRTLLLSAGLGLALR